MKFIEIMKCSMRDGAIDDTESLSVDRIITFADVHPKPKSEEWLADMGPSVPMTKILYDGPIGLMKSSFYTLESSASLRERINNGIADYQPDPERHHVAAPVEDSPSCENASITIEPSTS
ncbi:hypothetical protein [Salipiger bermudensis]|uniref:hypothetical protein n=1 Tax=Salipiger bermudensis TaxID=344736 RepID=UPI0035131B38